MRSIEIARQFSRTPAGRHRKDGPFSGEQFRDDVLVPALKSGAVEVVLAGAAGYPSSFLEEAFGGLIRVAHFDIKDLKEKLSIKPGGAEYQRYERDIWDYISAAATVH